MDDSSINNVVVLNERIAELEREIARRRSAETELGADRERLLRTLRSIGDGIIVTDAAGRVTQMNPSAADLTGWVEKEAVGHALDEVFSIVHESTREPVESPVQKVQRSGAITDLANHTILIARDGTQRPVDDSCAPIRDTQGILIGVVLVFRDASERRRTEEAEYARLLTLEREKRAEADRQKNEFLALLGHELRNPLAPIRNAVHLLAMHPDQPAVVAEAREMIGRQAAQMTRLVDELLDASRLVRRKVQLRRETLDLAALVQAAAQDHRPELAAAGLTLHLEIPPVPVRVIGDATRLTQVLGNLLHNAAKYTDRGGHVTIRLAEEAGQAALSVADTGIGIAPQALPHLFEAFNQVASTLERSKGGLGLGLSVVKGLVELHGGHVDAASEGLGRGTRFTVRLPLAPRGETVRTAPTVVTAAKGGRRRVLIVEDGRDAAESLRMLLTLHGFEVAVAYTGPEGVEQARQFHPEAVVCDLGLPGISGFEVARTLRSEAATATALLVSVSGYGQEEDKRQARAAGFDDALVKPVDPDVLIRLLARAN